MALATLGIAERQSLAQDPADLPPPQIVQPGLTGGLEQAQKRPFWGSGATRWFVAATMEAGFVYLRPQIALGYGKPHWSWVGIEGYSGVSTGGGVEYAGLRATTAFVDVRAGARYTYDIDQHFLLPQESYSRADSELRRGSQSRYVALEAEITGTVPLPQGSLFAVATGYAVVGVPPDYYVFEQSFHVIMAPPYVWRARLGYVASFGIDETLKVGAATEVIGIPGRDAFVVRAGPLLGVALTHHLEAVGAIMLVATSPDELGLRGAEFGQVGLRYKWAAGDRWPEFP